MRRKPKIGKAAAAQGQTLTPDQLNTRVAAFPDGRPYAYRIIEPRVFILSATFDL